AIGVQQFRPLADDPAVLLSNTGQKSRHVNKGHQWDVEGIAKAHKAGGFHRRIDVQNARQNCRLLGDNADTSTAKVRETDDDVLGKLRVYLEKIAIIDH